MEKPMNDLQIKWVDVKKLKPHPKNNNKHTPAQIERLAKLIAYQGQRTPIVVSNLSGFIVKGHATTEAIIKNEMPKAAVLYQDFEDEAQEWAYMTSDNAISEWATIDLSQINMDLSEFGPDFDVEMLGIKNFAIDPNDKFIENINRGDENAEWARMFPDFKEGDGYIKLTYMFKTEEQRKTYCEENCITIDHKRDSSWIVYK